MCNYLTMSNYVVEIRYNFFQQFKTDKNTKP